MTLARISEQLVEALAPLSFSAPVTHVYNPLVYARRPHRQYLEKYGRGRREILLMGMNPGPFGMAQTGVPFGEVSLVRDWLGISGPVDKPSPEHPKRPILGFDCTRSEVSGARLWGWARDRFGPPEVFFERFFVANYCPLVFMEQSGKNFTPDKLPAAQRDALLEICDGALQETVKLMKPDLCIGVGAFAEKRLKEALADFDVRVGRILHPSPASPIANRGWAEAAEKDLATLGIDLPA